MRGAVAWCALVPLVLASGCVENAILELDLELPTLSEVQGIDPSLEDPANLRYAFVQVRKATVEFHMEWRAADDPPGVALADQPTMDHISVVSEDESVDLHVRVRFCRSPACNEIGDDEASEVGLKINHPFYIGERTSFLAEIGPPGPMDEAPPPPYWVGMGTHEISKCLIRGCVAGDSSENYCRLSDSTHLCDR